MIYLQLSESYVEYFCYFSRLEVRSLPSNQGENWYDQSQIFVSALFLIFVFTGPVVHASDPGTTAYERMSLKRFEPFGQNYAAWQFTEGDESALDAHYSFRYFFLDCRTEKREKNESDCRKNQDRNISVFFAYTGEFDFYMGTRDSGPVINRISNPALHLLVDPFNKFKRADFLDIGIEHRSNGQATEIDELEGGQLKTVLYYGTKNENHFYDTLSRGSNFFSFTVGTNPRYISGATKPFSWKVTGRAYFTKNAEVNWGPLAGTGVDIDDYDLAKVTLRKTFLLTNLNRLKRLHSCLSTPLAKNCLKRIHWIYS